MASIKPQVSTNIDEDNPATHKTTTMSSDSDKNDNHDVHVVNEEKTVRIQPTISSKATIRRSTAGRKSVMTRLLDGRQARHPWWIYFWILKYTIGTLIYITLYYWSYSWSTCELRHDDLIALGYTQQLKCATKGSIGFAVPPKPGFMFKLPTVNAYKYIKSFFYFSLIWLYSNQNTTAFGTWQIQRSAVIGIIVFLLHFKSINDAAENRDLDKIEKTFFVYFCFGCALNMIYAMMRPPIVDAPLRKDEEVDVDDLLDIDPTSSITNSFKISKNLSNRISTIDKRFSDATGIDVRSKSTKVITQEETLNPEYTGFRTQSTFSSSDDGEEDSDDDDDEPVRIQRTLSLQSITKRQAFQLLGYTIAGNFVTGVYQSISVFFLNVLHPSISRNVCLAKEAISTGGFVGFIENLVQTLISFMVVSFYFSLFTPFYGVWFSGIHERVIFHAQKSQMLSPYAMKRHRRMLILFTQGYFDASRVCLGRAVMLRSTGLIFTLIFLKDLAHTLWTFGIKYWEIYVMINMKAFHADALLDMDPRFQGWIRLLRKFVYYTTEIAKRLTVNFTIDYQFDDIADQADLNRNLFKNRGTAVNPFVSLANKQAIGVNFIDMTYPAEEQRQTVGLTFANTRVRIHGVPRSIGEYAEKRLNDKLKQRKEKLEKRASAKKSMINKIIGREDTELTQTNEDPEKIVGLTLLDDDENTADVLGIKVIHDPALERAKRKSNIENTAVTKSESIDPDSNSNGPDNSDNIEGKHSSSPVSNSNANEVCIDLMACPTLISHEGFHAAEDDDEEDVAVDGRETDLAHSADHDTVNAQNSSTNDNNDMKRVTSDVNKSVTTTNTVTLRGPLQKRRMSKYTNHNGHVTMNAIFGEKGLSFLTYVGVTDKDKVALDACVKAVQNEIFQRFQLRSMAKIVCTTCLLFVPMILVHTDSKYLPGFPLADDGVSVLGSYLFPVIMFYINDILELVCINGFFMSEDIVAKNIMVSQMRHCLLAKPANFWLFYWLYTTRQVTLLFDQAYEPITGENLRRSTAIADLDVQDIAKNILEKCEYPGR